MEPILVFVLAGQRYALPSSDVREVVRAVTVTPLPGAPAIVEGVIDVRGALVPVLDMRSRFGLPARPVEHTDHLILAWAGARPVALRVDQALDLIRLDAGQVEDARRTVPGMVEHVAGVARIDHALVLIHDLQTFLWQDEAAPLDEALARARGGRGRHAHREVEHVMTRSRRRARTPIDWQAVRARLAHAHAATAAAHALPPERARALMDERARALAQRPAEATPPGDSLELLGFALGHERYAIETRFVREVMRSLDLTPVPGAPSFLLGITNLRGDVLAVIDLREMFGIAGRAVTELSRIVVLGAGNGELGIVASAVHAVDRVPAAAMLAPPRAVAGVAGSERAPLRGVTRDARMVIDGDALLADARLVIEQPGPDAPRQER